MEAVAMWQGPFVVYWQRTLKLAFPIMLSFLGAQAMEMIDTIMIGHLGVVPLAAAAFANSIVNIFVTVGLGFASAVSILVAQSNGGGRPERCGDLVMSGFWLNTVMALVMLALLEVILWFLPYLGQPPEVAAAAHSYYRVMALSVLPAVIFQTWKQFSDGLGHTGRGSLAILLSLLLNIAFNWILIHGHLGFPALGMMGAAWGTLLSRIVLAVGYFIFLTYVPAYRSYGLSLRMPKGLVMIRQLVGIGLPASLQYLFEVGVFSGATIMVGWMGAEALASHQIALKVSATCFMLPLALSFAASIRVGEASGQENPLLAWRLGCSTVLLAACLMVALGGLLYWGRSAIAWYFIDDAGVVALASSLLVVAAIFQLFDSTQAVAVGALRGMIDTRVPAVLTFIAYWLISFPAAYYFGFVVKGGVHGIWYGLMLGLGCASLLLNGRFFLLSRRLIRADALPAKAPLKGV